MRFIKHLIFLLLCSFLLASHSASAENLPKIRYFLQKENAVHSQTPYGNNLTSGHYVLAKDAKIYYESYGQGEVVCVLHGGGVGSPYELGLVIDDLRKHFKVLVVSTRGHGRSEIGHEPLSYEQKARDVLAVLKDAGVTKCSLLGFSDGAYTAYKFAVMYPDLVERVIGIGAGTLKSHFFPKEISLEALAQMDPKFVEQMQKLAPEPKRLQEFLSSYMQFWHELSVGQEIFANIKCPVLLICGDEDDHAPIKTVLAAHQLLPNSRLCVIPKAWHTAFLDNFPLTMLAIEQFLGSPVRTLSSSKKLDLNN